MRRTFLFSLAAATLLSFVGTATAATKEDTLYIDLKDGRVVIEMRPDLAPKHVAQIKALARAGKYDGIVFHRVIDGFMVQGGGMTPDLQEKPVRAPIKLEAKNGLSNVRGSVAMARTGIPDSATAQFFINLGDNLRLDAANAADGNGYAVFGQVIEGMDVVDKIKTVPVGNRAGHQNVPQQAVLIKQATLLEK